MDLRNPTLVFHSDCKNSRVTVEAALIHAAPTIQNNTASASVDSNELVAPIICRSTKFNWDKLSQCIPRLDKRSVARYKRYTGDKNAWRGYDVKQELFLLIDKCIKYATTLFPATCNCDLVYLGGHEDV